MYVQSGVCMTARYQGAARGLLETVRVWYRVAGSQLSNVYMSLKTRETMKMSNKKKKWARGELNRDSRGPTESSREIVRVEI